MKSVAIEYLYRACPTLVRQPYPTRSAWSVVRAWLSLSRHNAAPHYCDRASLSHAHSLVVIQCLAPLSRHRTLCRDMENLMFWNSLSRHNVYYIVTQFQATLSRHQIFCLDINSLGLCLKLGRDKKILHRDLKSHV